MRTPLLIFLCLSVLLSGCVTANSAIFKPEPGSSGDLLVRIAGGFTDGVIALAPIYLLEYEIDSSSGMLESFGPVVPLLIYLGIFVFDFAISAALPYRGAYYEDKEAEEGATAETRFSADSKPQDRFPT